MSSIWQKKICGDLYRCCWPCSCDLMNYTKVKKIKHKFKDGVKKIDVLLINNPCSKKDFPKDFLANYHTHLICHRGKIDFIFNEVKMSCKSNEFLFWFAKSNLNSLSFSKGFSATILLVENKFLMNNIPDQSWGIDAELHSRQYPVKQLENREDQRRILSNFR